MNNRTIYTRAYSSTTNRQLISGKGSRGSPLSRKALLNEFGRHANIRNRISTALVSVSDRIVDTLHRAVEKYDKYCESPAKIWIAFIEVPSSADIRIHSAKELKEQCGSEEPGLCSHEFVFEWAIPEQYVRHRVSLQTLIYRGLPERHFRDCFTSETRCSIAREFAQYRSSWEIGVYLGLFAQRFGARAPLVWIAHRLYYDCVRPIVVTEDVVRLDYQHLPTETVDFMFFRQLDDGIEDSLYDWWLTDTRFVEEYEEFMKWREEKIKLSAKHEAVWEDIEAEAVKIGL